MKPENIAVSLRENVLKILDFGCARANDNFYMTPDVSTTYYRAPEVILKTDYNEKVDVWSIGCIFAELICKKKMFVGNEFKTQFMSIIELLGSPNQEFVQRLHPDMQASLRNTQFYSPIPWNTLFPNSMFLENQSDNLNGKKK